MFRFIGPFSPALARTIAAACAASLCLLTTMALTHPATAAILHGDFSDIPPGAIMYLDVEESSFSEPVPPALYGPPTIAANTLDFDPSDFGTSSFDGTASRRGGQLSFTLGVIPGAGLTGLSMLESGNYQFAGSQADPETQVSASTDVTVRILAVDGLDLPNPIPVAATRVFTTTYADVFPATTSSPWSLETFVDLASAISFPYIDGVTKLDVAIDNQLTTATSGAGFQAAIDRTDVKIVPTVVPEPSSLALACLVGVFAALARSLLPAGKNA